MPLDEDIIKLYDSYYTHQNSKSVQKDSGTRTTIFDYMKAAYFSEEFGRADVMNQGMPEIRPGLLRKLLSIPAFFHPFFQASIHPHLRILGQRKRGRLLDVGCGNGGFIATANRLGWDAEGIDFDDAAVAYARKSGLTVHHGDLHQQRFSDCSYDLISIRHVIEHVPDPISLLAECRRLISHSGSVIVATPNAKSFGHEIFKENWRGLEVPRHLHVFSSASLQQAAKAAGFEKVVVSSIATMAPFIFAESGRIEKAARKTQLLRGSPPLLHRLRERNALLCELLVLKWRATAGEELHMVADRA